MVKKLVILISLIIILPGLSCAQDVKPPNVAGAFYPASASKLSRQIEDFLNQAQPPEIKGKIYVLISPHAGYIYSGSVAAYGYKLLKDKEYKTVIIIGPSHFEYFDGISVYSQGSFLTPLGKVAIDEVLAKKIIAQHKKISFNPRTFAREHSIEVQIPFLQTVLEDFKIVPIATGEPSWENCEILAKALEIIAERDDVLIVASTDMSHYHPYDKAREIDQRTIPILKEFDPRKLYNNLLARDCELCGQAAVITSMLYAQARRATDVAILKYANSGDTAGDKAKVVGYLSAVFYQKNNGGKAMLNEKQRKRLLQIARETVESYIRKGEIPEYKETDPALTKIQGAFVTLRRRGELRGCIGNIIGQQALYLTVCDMAVEATKDPRFIYNPITTKELSQLEVEISVLSPPKRIKDISEFNLGTHGVIVKRGFRSGVFLPQVAEETGWSKEEFLSNLCSHKAGLNPDAWKDKDTEVHIFSAEVFSEHDDAD